MQPSVNDPVLNVLITQEKNYVQISQLEALSKASHSDRHADEPFCIVFHSPRCGRFLL
jgi:hypothetical protein